MVPEPSDHEDDELEPVECEPISVRIGFTIVYGIVCAGSVALIFIVRNAIQGTGYVGPLPIMAILIYDLLMAVALIFLLNVLALWSPHFAIWDRLLDKAEGHMVPVAIIAFGFVVLMVAAGICVALGII